jgi:hypothetical protein
MNMMTLFAPVILVAAVSAVSAVSATAIASEGDDLCMALAGAAGTTMEARQEGIPVTRLLALVKPYEDEDEGVGVLLRGIILQAYDSPRFSTAKYRNEAIAEFQNQTLVNCLKFVEASK